jgi:hypothetical protein
MKTIITALLIFVIGCAFIAGCTPQPTTPAASPSPGAATPSPGAATAPASPGTASPAASPEQPKVKLIWDYDKELGLTPDQVTKMKKAVGSLGEDIRILRFKLSGAELELNKMTRENAPSDKVKAKVQEIEKYRGDMRIKDLETAKRINTILTKDQLEKWRKIQQEELKAQAEKTPAPEKAPEKK